MVDKVFIGLGNPGKKYEHTFHNAGAYVLGCLWENLKENADIRQEGETSWFRYVDFTDPISKKNYAFVWPSTFMNESGIAVKNALKFFKLEPENIVVLHDDSDLIIGNFKLSLSENIAGHHGLLSIQSGLKIKGFEHLRIGIRDPKEKVRKKAGEFVLKNIPKSKIGLFCSPRLITLWTELQKTT